ncbi:ExbD/TolR family protein [Colwelliaceae bacterium 6471]
MRRRKQQIFEHEDAKVDVTSLLDIIFIMLIFFIVTTSFVKDKGFLVKKTEANKSVNNKSKSINIHIDRNSTVYFNNKAVDIERIPARIELFLANNQTSDVLLRPHSETNYQKVVEILDQIKPFKRLKVSIGVYKP